MDSRFDKLAESVERTRAELEELATFEREVDIRLRRAATLSSTGGGEAVVPQTIPEQSQLISVGGFLFSFGLRVEGHMAERARF